MLFGQNFRTIGKSKFHTGSLFDMTDLLQGLAYVLMLHNWLYLNNYYTSAIINLLSIFLFIYYINLYIQNSFRRLLHMFYSFPSPTQYGCHPPIAFYLLILTCVMPVISFTVDQLGSIQGSQISRQLDTTRPPIQTNQRYLASDSETQTNSSTSFWEQNSKTNVYMILLIVGLSLLVIGGIICCIVITYRYYMGTNRTSPANRIANDHFLQLDLQMISPQIPYNLFLNEIGHPMHDNCVICLEPYSKQFNNFSSNATNTPQLTVSLTVCGHLIHSKCLKEWVNRQPNCPLCREPFSDENLTAWQQKLSIDFNYVYQTFKSVKGDENKKGKKRRKMMEIQKKKKEFSLRDSLELQWVKLYNSRPILNKERHAKYNIQNVFSRFLNVRNNKFYLSNIANESPSHTFSVQPESKCENISLDRQDRQHPDDWIYALMIYSSVMDYHDGKNLKKQSEHEQKKINNIQGIEINRENNFPNNDDGGSHQFQSSALDNSQI